MYPNALTIAGSDSGGGAGIQADLKTFAALGVYGASVITAVTAQNTVAVTRVHDVPANVVEAQLSAVLSDIRIDAVKIGMLPNAAVAERVDARLTTYDGPIVLDPVLIATSGARLVDDEARSALLILARRAALVTPNLFEAGVLLGGEAPRDVRQMEVAARALVAGGARASLVKGGHLDGETSVDVLFDGTRIERFEAARVATNDTHGSGCTLSSAIAARLAHGDTLAEAIAAAKAFVTSAIAAADRLDVGEGAGPLHHFFAHDR